MQPYHLAKLVEWIGTLQSRKRLQKVAYLLQESGCADLDASYILHHYGPYSWDVAGVADQLVRAGMLAETAELNEVGTQYSYQLTANGRQAVSQLENGAEAENLKSFLACEPKAKNLLGRGIGELEHGATMVYFYRQTKDWDKAVERTCKFKKLEKGGPVCLAALKLAQEIVQ